MPATQLDSNNFQPNSGIGSPTISNIQVTNSSYTVLDDTAVSTSGGFIKITGTKFNSGVQVYIGTILATSISLVNSTVLNVQVPATAAGSYDVTVVNTDGTYGIKPIGITFSPINITWVTSSSLGTYATGVAISLQLNATGAAGYQLQSGSTLPTGLTLSSSGLLSGTVNVVSNTTYSFTIEAFDSELQDAPRTFSLTVALAIPGEYLVVAGGGGGGNRQDGFDDRGGGGGAGGYLTSTVSILLNQTYTVTVGAGGTASISAQGGNGVNSVFGNIVATGGGGGGKFATAGSDGGSGGGGGAFRTAGNYAGGIGVAGPPRQGYNGGTGGTDSVTYRHGGGGGGAGAAGNNAGAPSSGKGGDGLQTSISGSATYYAGGGAGGGTGQPGGLGGGGSDSSPGATNTGGGGGGGTTFASIGASGGSGIVILRVSDSITASATTGSPTVTVTGGFRIYRFTGSGSITF